MNPLIAQKLPQLVELCKKYHVSRLYVFGSVLTERFRPDSDVDLIVDFDDWMSEGITADFFGFKDSLEELFSRRVDLLADQPIRNPILRQSVESTKQLIYGRAS